jgi:hypothetical protein
LCSGFGHTAPHCSHFRSSTQQPSAHLAVGNISATTWFPDTSANQHVTPDLGTLTDSTPYLGNDYLHVGDGKGLDISHIGHTKLHSPKRMFTLSNVLHVRHITKPLLSVQKLCCDNHVYFEFHASITTRKSEKINGITDGIFPSVIYTDGNNSVSKFVGIYRRNQPIGETVGIYRWFRRRGIQFVWKYATAW